MPQDIGHTDSLFPAFCTPVYDFLSLVIYMNKEPRNSHLSNRAHDKVSELVVFHWNKLELCLLYCISQLAIMLTHRSVYFKKFLFVQCQLPLVSHILCALVLLLGCKCKCVLAESAYICFKTSCSIFCNIWHSLGDCRKGMALWRREIKRIQLLNN